MPYVNFKEENYKLEKQISKRKENNKKIRSQIKNDKSLISGIALQESTVLKIQKNSL